MGSKSRIAKDIVPIIQGYIDENKCTKYIELFVGGANIIDKIGCNEKIGNDIQGSLISLLTYVQENKDLPNSITREEYSEVRSNPEKFDKWYVGCVGFLASYNGRYFDGGFAQAGYEKTKSGSRFRDYYREAKDNLLTQALNSRFKDVIFQCADYKDCIDVYRPTGSVIYCDPPYKGTKQFSNSKNFNHDEFWDNMRKLSNNNIVLISELEAPDDFQCIWKQEVSRSIKSTDKSKVVEKLFKMQE